MQKGRAPSGRVPSSGSSGSGQQTQLDARAELMAGSQLQRNQQNNVTYDAGAAALSEMNNREVLQYGLQQHKDTTASTKRALQIVESSKEIQSSTMGALKDQGEQMQRVATDMERIGQDLSYSERILRYMRLCCCVGFFCSCCTEPERDPAKDAQWRSSQQPSQQASSRPAAPPAARSMSKKEAKAAASAAERSAAARAAAPYAGPDTQGLDKLGYGAEAQAINAETEQQNAYLDQISQGLDQLKSGAMTMRDELGRQEAYADRLRNDAETLHGRLHHVNTKGFKNI